MPLRRHFPATTRILSFQTEDGMLASRGIVLQDPAGHSTAKPGSGVKRSAEEVESSSGGGGGLMKKRKGDGGGLGWQKSRTILYKINRAGGKNIIIKSFLCIRCIALKCR